MTAEKIITEETIANKIRVCVFISFLNFGSAMITIAEVKNIIPASIVIAYANPTSQPEDVKSGRAVPIFKYSDAKYCGA